MSKSSIRTITAVASHNAATKLARDPSVPVTQADAPNVQAVVEDVFTPVIEHLTNNEPWYQSRVTWGAIVTAGAGIAGLAGYTIDAEDQIVWVDGIMQGIQLASGAVALVGSFIVWYGRWKAKKPLGK